MQQHFGELCSATTQRVTYTRWRDWHWLRERVGPPGSSALLTPEAAEEIWLRNCAGSLDATADVADFSHLVRDIEVRCAQATRIQSIFRGRSGRELAGHTLATQRTETVPGAVVLAPFNPTPPCAVAQALDLLCVGPGDVLYDLGCGDGRLLVAAARRGARCVGVEYDRPFAEKARSALRDAGFESSCEVLHADACTVDLSGATKIFVYLVPEGLRRMCGALDVALRRGVPVASYLFSLPGHDHTEALSAETRPPECCVRLYRDPAV